MCQHLRRSRSQIKAIRGENCKNFRWPCSTSAAKVLYSNDYLSPKHVGAMTVWGSNVDLKWKLTVSHCFISNIKLYPMYHNTEVQTQKEWGPAVNKMNLLQTNSSLSETLSQQWHLPEDTLPPRHQQLQWLHHTAWQRWRLQRRSRRDRESRSDSLSTPDLLRRREGGTQTLLDRQNNLV